METAVLDARQFLNGLQKVSKSGKGWVACCPAHDDAEPSLSVSDGQNGKVLVHCHKGCTVHEIAAAKGVPISALMGAESDAPPRATSKPPSEHYDYEDEDGRVLFRVDRYYVKKGNEWKKRFAQKKALGGGEFASSREDARLVPYNLPTVLAAIQASEPVFVVEGEKDVHTLRDWGLVATCNPGGAGKWEASFARLFQDASVVVIPDNDEPGRAHAAAVVANLRTTAESVVVVELPGLLEKEDLTDWKRKGHTADELAGLVDRARVSAPFLDDPVEIGPLRRPLVNLPSVDQGAIVALPQMLRELCGHYPAGIERTVALTSALAVVSGMMPNVRVDHYDKAYGLQLMFCLVARSGGGKGVLDQVARIGSKVDESVRADARWHRDDWDRQRSSLKGADRAEMGPKPFDGSAFIPANASKTYMIRAIEAAGETACMVETEIDTLVGANAQDYGDFTDLIRKAFHHEPYRMGRIGSQEGETLAIERPSLSLAISGTWGQFERLFGDNVDNGFFNRFCFVVSNAGRSYRSPRPTHKSWAREAWFTDAAKSFLDLYSELSSRKTPLLISLNDESWDLLDEMFRPAYERAAEAPSSERTLPFVQRSALMAVRLAGVLTMLRAWEHNVDVHAPALVATTHDVKLARHIVSVWFDHGCALLTHLTPQTGPDPLVSLTDEAREVFEALPQTFKRADANAAGKVQDVSERTVKRYLKQYQEAGLILRNGHTYAKVEASSEALPFGDAVEVPS